MADDLRLELLQVGTQLGKRAAIRILELEAALEQVKNWEFPPSDRFFEDGTEMSYSAAFGSNGVRDYMRKVATKVLENKC